MVRRKSQGALEYLITYGWAILLIVIVGGALFALGVFNPSNWLSNKRATGFSSFHVDDWAFYPGQGLGTLTLVVGNKFGSDLRIHNISVLGSFSTQGGLQNGTGEAAAYIDVRPEEKVKLYVVGFNTIDPGIGTAYSMNVRIHFQSIDTGLNHTDFGVLTGKTEG